MEQPVTRAWRRTLSTLGQLAVGAALIFTGQHYAPWHATADTIDTVCASELPDEAHEVMERITTDAPHPHKQDGTVFQNREGVLPDRPKGYYHEFTVETPGLDHRGAKRIVTGGDVPDQVDDYYTDDHYKTFDLIDYSCGTNSDSTPAPTTQPTDQPTAEPPAGTDLTRVGAICATDLNGETRETLDLIWKNGPFPYPKKDGSTFEWRDHDPYPFPRKEDGYYLEWTVPTPGEKTRGAQRIVTGGDPADKVEDFYTADHYDTFELIDYGC